ncbi:hypothetical protein [Citreicoccus inhibens]|uniref:hypothetical protein n=1 Tax=Citreicoccus inhibens TaxID=2849499 RepID=UPI0038B2FE6A
MGQDISSNGAAAGTPGPTAPHGLFTAFHERKPSSTRRAVVLGAAVVLALGGWALSRQAQRNFRVLTPHGIRTVSPGMSQGEVVAVLGRPLTLDKVDGADCYRYGQPTLRDPTFVVYSVCYADGVLRDVKQHKYSAWNVDPKTGTFVPAAGGAGAAPQPESESSAGGQP